MIFIVWAFVHFDSNPASTSQNKVVFASIAFSHSVLVFFFFIVLAAALQITETVLHSSDSGTLLLPYYKVISKSCIKQNAVVFIPIGSTFTMFAFGLYTTTGTIAYNSNIFPLHTTLIEKKTKKRFRFKIFHGICHHKSHTHT